MDLLHAFINTERIIYGTSRERGYGNYIKYVINEFTLDSCPKDYLIYIIDENERDINRKKDQVVVSIPMCNQDVL